MPLPSFLQPKASTASRNDGAADEAGPVRDARLRARRRLMGAVVLLAAGLVVFPLLFESEPRPMPMDIPIVAARKDGAATAVATPPKPRAVTVVPPPDAGNETPVRVAGANESSTPARVQADGVAAVTPAPVPAPAPVPKAVLKPVPKPVPKPAPAAASAALSTPAAAASATGGRFVVQVGAYTDAISLREIRTKVEKLGLKTYTQVVETPSGPRTRVRIGPFETRDEADRASAQLKAASLPAYILAL